MVIDDADLRVPTDAVDVKLDGFLRRSLGISWGDARSLVERGKVFVEGARADRSDRKVAAGARVEVRIAAPRSSPTERGPFAIDGRSIVHVDTHVVVVRKPAGISTVAYDERELDTLDRRVRQWLVRHQGHSPHASLGIVHRIDKETSGLVVFTRTLLGKKILANAFRSHTIERRYLALVQGSFRGARTIESTLLADRGDHLRGSARGRTGDEGQRAVTHVRELAVISLPGAPVEVTAVACALETGRTHQIRIHLSEAGHPLLGDRVYCRDFQRRERPIVEAPRLMLHAAVLGFTHPATSQPMRFEEPLPEDIRAVIARIGGGTTNVELLERGAFG